MKTAPVKKESKNTKKGFVNIYVNNTDKELFLMYSEKRDIAIRNELIQRNLYIAEILSKKYINKGIEYEDIYQVASLGLIYAIERYDITKGFEFSSFATPTIIGEIKKYFRDKGWSIRVPRRIQELSKRVNTVKNELQQETHKTPRISDIAGSFATTAMLTRNSFLEEIRKQYVLTARAKGLGERQVLYGHVLRNALIPIVTGFPAAFIGAFFTGALLIETLFSLDGLGLLSYESVIRRDYPVVLGTLYLFTLISLVTRLVSDLCYVWVDPRVKFD